MEKHNGKENRQGTKSERKTTQTSNNMGKIWLHVRTTNNARTYEHDKAEEKDNVTARYNGRKRNPAG